jgi:predicted Zn-dependent protease
MSFRGSIPACPGKTERREYSASKRIKHFSALTKETPALIIGLTYVMTYVKPIIFVMKEVLENEKRKSPGNLGNCRTALRHWDCDTNGMP